MLYHKLKYDFVFYKNHLKTLRPNHKDTINSYFEKLQERWFKGTSLTKVHWNWGRLYWKI